MPSSTHHTATERPWLGSRNAPHKNGSSSYKLYWRDGRRVRTQTFRTRAEAVRARHEIEHAKSRGSYVDPALGEIMLAEFGEYFIRTSPPPRKPPEPCIGRMPGSTSFLTSGR